MADEDTAEVTKTAEPGIQQAELFEKISDLKAETASLRTEMQVNAEHQAAQAAQATEQKTPVYTAADLQKAVDEGTLTEVSKAEILRNQDMAQIREEALATARQEVKAQFAAEAINVQVEAWKSVRPDIAKVGTADNRAYNAELSELAKKGLDIKDPAMELVAVELAFGSLEKSKGQTFGKETTSTRAAPANQETSHSQRSDTSTPQSDGSPSIDSRRKAHYEDAIKKGRYSGWDDPMLVKELAYTKKRQAAEA